MNHIREKKAVETKLLPWFRQHKRILPWREEKTPYRIWISELLLQQTQVSQVVDYFNRFMQRFPTLKSLAQAPREDVLKLWEGLGYYARARNLHKTAQILHNDYKGTFPKTIDGLIKLPGIGPYTAAAIASIAFGADTAVLDGNVIRVLSRIFAFNKDVRSATNRKQLQEIANQLLVKGEAADFNEAMMELGAVICTPQQPDCSRCPLHTICKANAQKTVARYPFKSPAKKTPIITVGAGIVINKQGKYLIAQRKDDVMLGGLWEFPGGKQEKGESIKTCIKRELQEELGITVSVQKKLVTVHHTYSHFRLVMHTYFCTLVSGTPKTIDCNDFRWCNFDELRKYPYSKADLKILDALDALAE